MNDGDIRDLLADHALGLLEPDEVARVEAALAASLDLRREAAAVRSALYAVPLALRPEPTAPGAWQALLARVRSGGGANTVGETATAGEPSAATRRRPSSLALGAALAATLVLLAMSVGWGVAQQKRVALQAHEQAVVAYWMRVPGMHVVPLQEPDQPLPGVHPGIVCMLPDGRAMVLQPHRAPQGASYVLYGDTGSGQVELGRTRGTLIEFHTDGLQSVEVRVPGPQGGVVAKASLQ